MIPNTTLTSKCCQPFTFPHGRSPHYTFVYTFTRRVLCQISAATKLTLTQYQLGSQVQGRNSYMYVPMSHAPELRHPVLDLLLSKIRLNR